MKYTITLDENQLALIGAALRSVDAATTSELADIVDDALDASDEYEHFDFTA